jgi:hypothetical protein
MKIVQCPKWCVGETNENDYIFIIKKDINEFSHRSIDDTVTYFRGLDSDILNPRDITILDNIAED